MSHTVWPRKKLFENSRSHFYYLQGANFGQEIFHADFIAESFNGDTVNETNFDNYRKCKKCQCRNCNCLNGDTFPEAGFSIWNARFLCNISYVLTRDSPDVKLKPHESENFTVIQMDQCWF